MRLLLSLAMFFVATGVASAAIEFSEDVTAATQASSDVSAAMTSLVANSADSDDSDNAKIMAAVASAVSRRARTRNNSVGSMNGVNTGINSGNGGNAGQNRQDVGSTSDNPTSSDPVEAEPNVAPDAAVSMPEPSTLVVWALLGLSGIGLVRFVRK